MLKRMTLKVRKVKAVLMAKKVLKVRRDLPVAAETKVFKVKKEFKAPKDSKAKWETLVSKVSQVQVRKDVKVMTVAWF